MGNLMQNLEYLDDFSSNIPYFNLFLLGLLGIINKLPSPKRKRVFSSKLLSAMCILYTASICIDVLVVLGLQTRQVFTAEQINEATYVDIYGSKALFDSLRNNPKLNLMRGISCTR